MSARLRARSTTWRSILEVIAGHDPADPDTAAVRRRRLSARSRTSRRRLPPRFAFVRTPMWDKADGETKAAFEELASALGGAIEDVDLPQSFAEAWEIHRAIMATDMAHNLAPYLALGEPSEALRKLVAHGRACRRSIISPRSPRRRAMRQASPRSSMPTMPSSRRRRPALRPRARLDRRSGVLHLVDSDRVAGLVAAAVRRRRRAAARRAARRSRRPRRSPHAYRDRAARDVGRDAEAFSAQARAALINHLPIPGDPLPRFFSRSSC